MSVLASIGVLMFVLVLIDTYRRAEYNGKQIEKELEESGNLPDWY